jgi:hypothetical protein
MYERVFYFLYYDHDTLILMEINTLVHHIKLLTRWKQAHGMEKATMARKFTKHNSHLEPFEDGKRCGLKRVL